jgi:hypothetical protein
MDLDDDDDDDDEAASPEGVEMVSEGDGDDSRPAEEVRSEGDAGMVSRILSTPSSTSC